MKWLGLVFFAYMCSAWVAADPVRINEARATYNYQMFCQGCHTPDGAGANYVPPLKNSVGYYLRTPAGRDYLVRVPGSATSVLKDADLAEVLNWILLNFAGSSLPGSNQFEPYTADEVATLRQRPLEEVFNYRLELLAAAMAVPGKE